ncbi:hypothetical protein K501DRAFT_275509 [Backusella circina FSU 941]|nr:hypothetical protein K501DRAFT_275509 [Backusella circina FSU 941]
MTDRFTMLDNYSSIKSKWQQNMQQQQQLNPIPTLFNTFLQELWIESANMMDFIMTEPVSSSTVMQGYIFKQMEGFLCTRQRFYELLEMQDEPIEYTPSPLASLLTESTISEPYASSCSGRSSDLDSTPLLTSHPSTSTMGTQELIKGENKEPSDTRRHPKLSPSPSTPTLGKSYTSSCCSDGHFQPACNYLCYYPNHSDKVGGENCHFCNELITPPLKKSFSMEDFSNRPLDDDSSYYTSDESTINKQVQPLVHKVLPITEGFEYQHVSSFTEQSNDSLDSIIQQHQDIISQSLQTNKKEHRKSMFGLFSHKKLSSFFSLKKKKKVASSYSFYQKKDMSVLN